MMTDLRKPFLRGLSTLAFSAHLLLPAPAFAEGPFDPFVGEWRGDGIVTTSDGQQAPLRCKVEILAEVGERASQALRCASTGAVIVINSSMRLEQQDQEKVLVGSWSNDRGNAGGLTGKIDSRSVEVMLAGEEVEAQMISAIDGCKLTVAIEGQLGKIANLRVDLEKGC
ncbi:MAG: hypothetical protein R3D43_11040 [Tepidamorphaceae bacterium]|nr:hypothetical protein [Rhodobiaceae bacterium]MCC0048849.1 hypothetical protein [Rhodobiaceae bacterium]